MSVAQCPETLSHWREENTVWLKGLVPRTGVRCSEANAGLAGSTGPGVPCCCAGWQVPWANPGHWRTLCFPWPGYQPSPSSHSCGGCCWWCWRDWPPSGECAGGCWRWSMGTGRWSWRGCPETPRSWREKGWETWGMGFQCSCHWTPMGMGLGQLSMNSWNSR